ncbi:MAG: hypothetical protein IJS45_11960 [Clostridia bacterium]|nr:hypothetical protein [Clostridia bacterium]
MENEKKNVQEVLTDEQTNEASGGLLTDPTKISRPRKCANPNCNNMVLGDSKTPYCSKCQRSVRIFI